MTSSNPRGLFLLLSSLVLTAASFAAETAPSAASPAASSEAAPKHKLRQILVTDSVESAQQLTLVPNSGFVVLTPAVASLDLAELTKRLADGENQFIEPKLLIAIGQVIENLARQQNYPHAIAMIPTQNIADGAVRVVLLLRPPLIRQILIGTSDDAQKLEAVPGGGLVVLSPAFANLPRADLSSRLEQAENQPFQEKLLAAIAQVTETFFKLHDYPVATAVIPPQNAADGLLRIEVHLGKIRSIKVAGNRWFSESLLREKLRIEQGETLRLSELDRAVSWTNNNPFRRVRVKIDPVSNTGEADLTIAVQEAFPLRAQASYDNGGNELVGQHRFTTAFTYANLWGRDHQISYQLLTTNLGWHVYTGHGLDYRVPLPWHDTIQLSGSYLVLHPTIIPDLLTQEGRSVTANLRYTHPIRTGDSPAEIYAGFEFKQSNNNLLFWTSETSNQPVLTNTTDVFQFTAGGSLVHRDRRGAWGFGANLNLSPGRFNSRNSDEAFSSSRLFSKSRYAYGQLSFQRLLSVHRGWDLMSRGIAQFSSRNLLSSEQLFIGGASSVRGFRENVFGGDSGFLLTNELLSPAIKYTIPRLPQLRNVLETRFAGFYDLGHVRLHERAGGDAPITALASAGLGVRMNIANNFSLTADYGWQITNLPYPVDERSRGHIRATLAF